MFNGYFPETPKACIVRKSLMLNLNGPPEWQRMVSLYTQTIEKSLMKIPLTSLHFLMGFYDLCLKIFTVT